MFKFTIQVILFCSLFIALCAVGLCMETHTLIGIPFNNFSFYCFVFGATLLQYNLHYLVKKKAHIHSERFDWSQQHQLLHKVFAALGALCITISLFSFHLQHFIVMAVLCVLASLYSFPLLPFKKKRLKDFGLMKILLLSLEWALVTVWFPLAEQGVHSAIFWLIFIRRFVFMFVLCLAFDIRDMEGDTQENIGTIPVAIGIKKSYILADILLVLFVLLSAVHLYINQDLIQFNALLLSALATRYIIQLTKKNNSDYLYLLGVDGMMLLQALLVMIGRLVN